MTMIDVVFVQASTRVLRNKPPARHILLWQHANTRSLCDSDSEFSASSIDNNSSNSDIKSKRCDSSGVSTLKSDGFAYSNPKIQATLLNNQFSSALTAEDQLHLSSMDGEPYPKMHNFTITGEGVEKLIPNWIHTFFRLPNQTILYHLGF